MASIHTTFPSEQDRAHTYALSLLARKPYTKRALHTKLLTRFSHTIAEHIIAICETENLINDDALAPHIAETLIARNPISKTRLHHKMSSYGFETIAITHAITYIEKQHEENTLQEIGGMQWSFLMQDYPTICEKKSIWSVLALCAYIIMQNTTVKPLTYDTVLRRLQLRGFHLHDIYAVSELLKD